jgi:hypothetical protein
VSRALGIDVLYSVAPPSAFDAIYGERLPQTEILPTLTGYVPASLVGRATTPLEARPVDVGYRGRSLPYWTGRLGYEKVEIGRAFAARCETLGLRCDIDWREGGRLYGDSWNRFLSACRATLASESGSSLVDFDGSIEAAVRTYLLEHPSADYLEVERAVLDRLPPGPAVNAASPRLFEAAALRTALVCFPGEYSGVVRPWEHYIPLEKDFSNVEDVAAHIRDDAFVAELTDRAYDDLIASAKYSDRTFVERFDEEMDERAAPRVRRGPRPWRVGLRLEELSAGRGYHVSAGYALARKTLLATLGARHALRSRAVLELARLAASVERHADRTTSSWDRTTSSWDDVFRLAVLRSFQDGTLAPRGERFRVVPVLEADGRRLVLTSVAANDAAAQPTPETVSAVREALQAGAVEEILWNHGAFDQYVALPLPLTQKRIAFDVGRYDAYGVYAFRTIPDVARRRPDVVLRALEPFLPLDEPGKRLQSPVGER